jgi:hypothetical protein
MLSALVCAATLGLGTSVASADTSDTDGFVPVAPPASNQCEGPGCAGDGDQARALVQLLGTGPGCADGGACFWAQSDFDGDKTRVDDVPCCMWFGLADLDRFRSAKNRYLSRKVLTANSDNQTSCMDPGENRSDLDASDRFRVGAVGSRCS